MLYLHIFFKTLNLTFIRIVEYISDIWFTSFIKVCYLVFTDTKSASDNSNKGLNPTSLLKIWANFSKDGNRNCFYFFFIDNNTKETKEIGWWA